MEKRAKSGKPTPLPGLGTTGLILIKIGGFIIEIILAGYANFQIPGTPEGQVIMSSENAISTPCKPVKNGQNDFILHYIVALGEGSSPPGF